jgi:hypothetical protein
MGMKKSWVLVLGIVMAGMVGSTIAAREKATARAISNGSVVRAEVGFHGLVAVATTPGWDRATVLLVDVAHSRQDRLPAHRPQLILPVAAVQGARPDAYADPEHTRGMWDLRHQEVRFERGETSDTRVVAAHTATDVRYPTSREQWRDVRWIADFERILGPGQGVVKTGYVTGPLRGPSPVTTRIVLEAGAVEASEPAEPYNALEFQFLPVHGGLRTPPVRQPLSERLVFVPTPTATLRIVLTPFDGSPARTIALRAGSGIVPIEITNLPDPVNHGTMAEGTPAQELAAHFAAFYDLLATPVAERLIPGSPQPFSILTAAPDVEPVLCLPGRMVWLPSAR